MVLADIFFQPSKFDVTRVKEKKIYILENVFDLCDAGAPHSLRCCRFFRLITSCV